MKKCIPLLVFFFSTATAQPLTKLLHVYESNESFCSALGKDALGNLFAAGRCGKNTIAGTIDTIKFEGMYLTKMNSTGGQIWRMNNIKGPAVTPRAVLTDNANNIFVVGNFYDSLIVGASVFTTTHDTFRKFFVAKYKANGTFIWIKVATSNEAFVNAATLKTNQLYLTGGFKSTFNYQGTTLTSAGSNDIWVLKLDTAGTSLSSTRFGGTGDDAAEAIELDATNNIFLSGYYSGAFNFGTNPITSHGMQDCFLTKLSAALAVNWVKTAGSTGRDVMRCMALDASGNIYAGGIAKTDLQFDPSAYTLVIPSQSGFIAKFNAAGVYQDSRIPVKNGNCIQMRMVGNRIVWCGKARNNGPIYFDNSVPVNVGHADDGYYIILDSAFNAKSIGLYSQITGAEQRCFSVEAIDNSNFIIAGFTGHKTRMPDTIYYNISNPSGFDNIYGGFSFIQKITIPHLNVTQSINPILPPNISGTNPLIFTLNFGVNTISSTATNSKIGFPKTASYNYQLASSGNYFSPGTITVYAMSSPPGSLDAANMNFYFQNKNLMVQSDNEQIFCHAVSPADASSAVCSLDSVTLVAFPGCSNYAWYQAPNTFIDSSQQIIIFPSGSTTYYVIADSLGQCRYKAYVVTTGYAPSIPVISQTGNVLFSSGAAAFYQWYVDGVAIPGATNYYYTPTGPGSYQVEDINTAGCSSISDPFVIVSTFDLPDGASINVFPNPADESMSISFVHFSLEEKINVKVVNAFGQVMQTKEVRIANGNFITQIETKQLPAGFYGINISGAHIQYSQKLLVIH